MSKLVSDHDRIRVHRRPITGTVLLRCRCGWLSKPQRKTVTTTELAMLADAHRREVEAAERIPTLPVHGHDPGCLSLKLPAEDYELGNPDSAQHCRNCHCSCDPDGPGCGHWAGCPGC